MILARATGQPAYQLVLRMAGSSIVMSSSFRQRGESDLILVEGVMGLFSSARTAEMLASAMSAATTALNRFDM